MAISAGQLGQLRPGDANAASIYSPAASVTAKITSINVCNVSANPRTFRIFHDDDGATYDEDTAIRWDVALAANTSVTIENPGIYMNDSDGNLAVRSDAADELNFTVYGIETS